MKNSYNFFYVIISYIYILFDFRIQKQAFLEKSYNSTYKSKTDENIQIGIIELKMLLIFKPQNYPSIKNYSS